MEERHSHSTCSRCCNCCCCYSVSLAGCCFFVCASLFVPLKRLVMRRGGGGRALCRACTHASHA
jgi:hypothetical protein